MLRFSKIYILICWSFLILRLLTFPMASSGSDSGFCLDKVVHFFLFGIFVMLFHFAFSRKGSGSGGLALIAFLAGSLFSYLAEFLQNFVPGRTVSSYDLAAGVLGSFIFAFLIYLYAGKGGKEKMLLHVCCAGCGAYVSGLLSENYDVTLFFDNSNLDTEEEYEKRLEEARKIAEHFKIKAIAEPYDHGSWLEYIKGHEGDPEKGGRCLLCYKFRLERTAGIAKQKKFDIFTTTLSVSPHKLADAINAIGRELAEKYGIRFLESDFKKQDGYKRSVSLSRELGLYRQDYCGCEFSRR